MNILIVQPHRDDAVFSICEHMLGWLEDGHQLTLLTVFGAIPDWEPDQTKHAVFDYEHQRVVKALGIDRDIQFYFADAAAVERAPYELDQTFGQIRTAIEDVANPDFYDVTVWPNGIHHTDHAAVAQARYRMPSSRQWVYDELPYYVLYPDWAVSCSATQQDDFECPERVPFQEGFLDRKKVLCRMYASQFGETEERCLWAPERVWRMA